MPDTYEYKVRDKSGNMVTGTLVADSELLVLQRLREMGYTPLEVGKEKRGLNLEINVKKAKVKLKDLAVFSRQFATMINSGLPILRALSILADQTENKLLGETLNATRMDVEQGASLSGAMAKHPKVFNELYVSMVKSGETGGSLDTTLLSLASMLEREVHLRGKIKSAMTYPIAVIVLVLLIMSAMLFFVVPQFEGIYSQLGGTLPLPTRALLFASQMAKKYWWMIVVGRVRVPVLLPSVEGDRQGPRRDRPAQAPGPGVRIAVPQDRAVAVLEHAGHAAPCRRPDPAGPGHRGGHGEQPGDRQSRDRRPVQRP